MKPQNLPHLVKATSGGLAQSSVNGLKDTPLMQQCHSGFCDNGKRRIGQTATPSVIRFALHYIYRKLYSPHPVPALFGRLGRV